MEAPPAQGAHLRIHLAPPAPERKWRGAAFPLGSRIQETHAEPHRPGVAAPTQATVRVVCWEAPDGLTGPGTGLQLPLVAAALCGELSAPKPTAEPPGAPADCGRLNAPGFLTRPGQPSGQSPPWPVATAAQVGGMERGRSGATGQEKGGEKGRLLPQRERGVKKKVLPDQK